MRQGQHKNRSRNRSRRPSNSVNRVYESNGPDVKVRGTAQTVADKYLQLARDAASSGDIVKAESFYQHAEHYLRIIATNLPAGQQGQQQRRSTYDDDNYEDGDDNDGGSDDATETRHQQANRDTDSEQDDNADADESRRQPRAQPKEQPQPHVEPQPQPARESASDDDGGNGWDGHQPDFLRRGGQPNGAPAASSPATPTAASTPRPRRERRPRTRQPQPQPELAGSEQPQIPVVPADDGENTGDNS